MSHVLLAIILYIYIISNLYMSAMLTRLKQGAEFELLSAEKMNPSDIHYRVNAVYSDRTTANRWALNAVYSDATCLSNHCE